VPCDYVCEGIFGGDTETDTSHFLLLFLKRIILNPMTHFLLLFLKRIILNPMMKAPHIRANDAH
jgi:hypothetical protein